MIRKSGSDKYIQGIRFHRQSASRIMDGGSEHCIEGSDQNHTQKRKCKGQNSCLRRPYK